MSEIHVSCAARGIYVQLSAVMLSSLLEHTGQRPVTVHFLHAPEEPAETLRALDEMVSTRGGALNALPVAEERVAELPSRPEFTSAMWYRILLPELLPEVERVLYLDVDTMVVDSLEPLWETDVSEHLLGAVSNVFQDNHLHRPGELGIPSYKDYFNSGVMLMNLREMRRCGAAGQVRRCAIERGEELEWPDQDALNLVLGARRLPLHPRWNCMNSVLNFGSALDVFPPGEAVEARSRPAIRHFEGPGRNKPWHPRCPDPLRPTYLRHLGGSPWPELRVKDAGPQWPRPLQRLLERTRGRRT